MACVRDGWPVSTSGTWGPWEAASRRDTNVIEKSLQGEGGHAEPDRVLAEVTVS